MLKNLLLTLSLTLSGCSIDPNFKSSAVLPPSNPAIAELGSCSNSKFQISRFLINDGEEQRSQVKSLVLEFDRAVPNIDSITIRRQSDGKEVKITSRSSTSNVVTFGFLLEDGIYNVHISDCKGMDFVLLKGGLTNFKLFRLFGDINGDGAVAANDFTVFRMYFNGTYEPFDYDGDGAVATSDFNQFRMRFNGSLTPQ